MQKRDKATTALSILAIQEQNEKKIKRRNELCAMTSSRNKVVATFGPVTAGDARLRAAHDEYNRQARKEDALSKRLKKELAEEQQAIRRWVSYFRKTRNDWIKMERVRLQALRMPLKEQRAILKPRQDELTDLVWLVQQYRQQRQAR
ncbi:hypothetical protein N658DRAFT_511840 [Parathielavia hyrcaniae]|uniref:Uncharacterized protein n=1 Tax=Parathielavia hyrcaniae TaxID=113614 RepID=A0AAN6PUP5_9PEZI|nr:hypothetical protein N658DRAFT_511840 [Parathielavia hyrcaniae]